VPWPERVRRQSTLVLGDLPRAVDVNARPTTSIIGIVRVMREEIGELMLAACFGGMPKKVRVDGEYISKGRSHLKNRGFGLQFT